MLSWWETIGGRPPTEIALWRGGSGNLEAVLLLSRTHHRLLARSSWSVPIWTNTGSGPGAADHCGWPVLPHRLEDVRQWIAERTKGTPLLLRNLDPSTGVPLVGPGAVLVGRTACPWVSIPRTDASPAAAPTPSGRMRKRARELEDAGVTFRWVPPERMKDEVLDALFRLHEERMQAKGHPTRFQRRERELHHQLIARGGVGRGPAALLAEQDGGPIAVEYGFLWRDVFAGYQSGWDPAWAHLRLGGLLLRETIRCLGDRGVRTFDFLRGREPHKYEFGASDRWDETWFVPGGPAGRLLAMRERAWRLFHPHSGPYPW